jgi:hypothetical protein
MFPAGPASRSRCSTSTCLTTAPRSPGLPPGPVDAHEIPDADDFLFARRPPHRPRPAWASPMTLALLGRSSASAGSRNAVVLGGRGPCGGSGRRTLSRPSASRPPWLRRPRRALRPRRSHRPARPETPERSPQRPPPRKRSPPRGAAPDPPRDPGAILTVRRGPVRPGARRLGATPPPDVRGQRHRRVAEPPGAPAPSSRRSFVSAPRRRGETTRPGGFVCGPLPHSQVLARPGRGPAPSSLAGLRVVGEGSTWVDVRMGILGL